MGTARTPEHTPPRSAPKAPAHPGPEIHEEATSPATGEALARAEHSGHRLEQVSTRAPSRFGQGKQLPEALRQEMEQSFGHDFSQVRLHLDGEAPRLGARAFTRGTDIHLPPHAYSPHSPAGRHVLAHELAHVVQQHAGRVAGAPDGGASININPALEREADSLGARAVRGESVDMPGAGLPRAPMASIPPIQGLHAVVQGSNEFVQLKKSKRKGGDVYKHEDGRVFTIVGGSTAPHPVKGTGSYDVVTEVPKKAKKVKQKDQLESGYDSGGDSGSESDLDPSDYTDVDSEDEDDWELHDKAPGRTTFWDRAVTEESSHFGVSAPPVDTSHHALASTLETGLTSGNTTPSVPLGGVSSTQYIRAHVKASKDAPPNTWGGTNQQPRQSFTFGGTTLHQQRKPSANQPMNLQMQSFGHYGIPKPGVTGLYPSQTVIQDIASGTGWDKPGIAQRIRMQTQRGKPIKEKHLGVAKTSQKPEKVRRMNALIHLMGREEVLRAIHQSDVNKRLPAGTAFSMGLELLEKDPKFSFKHMLGRNAKYGPMTPGGVASDPLKFKRRYNNLLTRLAKLKLRRNKKLRDLVTKSGKKPEEIGKSFVLVPKGPWLQKKLQGTFNDK